MIKKITHQFFARIFNKKKETQPNSEEKEYTFIWYKKMISGSKTHYTSPFRTKVKAKTKTEAVDKITSFALSKMTLCVVEEKDFNKSEIMKIQKTFNDLNKIMEDTFDKFKAYKKTN